MMTPWGRIGGSQENARDLGPLAEMVKFAGGLPGATGRPIQIINREKVICYQPEFRK